MTNLARLKAIYRIAGIIAFAALIGFSMIACDNDTTSGQAGYNPGGGGGGNVNVVGTWRGSFTYGNTTYNRTMVFNTNMTCTGYTDTASGTGTYSVAANTVYITWSNGDSNTLTITGNNTMTLAMTYNGAYVGTMTLYRQ
jgi:hypothetical protein